MTEGLSDQLDRCNMTAVIVVAVKKKLLSCE
jgi:hypothetical protein